MTNTVGSLSNEALAQLSAEFETANAADIVAWAAETFGDQLCLTASMTDTVLIDVASAVAPRIEIAFIDTGYHFPETLGTVEAVRRRYNPNLVVLRAEAPLDNLWQTDTDACCARRKVQPLQDALVGKQAWLSGVRRADGPSRADTSILERDKRGLIKVSPLATWSDADVERYISEQNIIMNPLVAQGYPSIGCWPCTNAVAPGDDPRTGRWAGTDKTECGLHL